MLSFLLSFLLGISIEIPDHFQWEKSITNGNAFGFYAGCRLQKGNPLNDKFKYVILSYSGTQSLFVGMNDDTIGYIISRKEFNTNPAIWESNGGVWISIVVDAYVDDLKRANFYLFDKDNITSTLGNMPLCNKRINENVLFSKK